MEIIQIKSGHSLVSNMVTSRPVEAQTYMVNCSQYVSMFQKWQRSSPPEAEACGFMTLDYVRIWLTSREGKEIADAIKAARSPVVFD